MALVLSACGHAVRSDTTSAAETATEHAAIAETIRAHYEAVMADLPPSRQRHYAQRLYRITGDARYVPGNRAYGLQILQQLQMEMRALTEPGFTQQQAQALIDKHPTRTPQQRARKRMLNEWGDMAYARELVFNLIQLQAYGLLNKQNLPDYPKALAYLRQVDFQHFMLDPDVLSLYAAQVANLVTYLHQLAIVDLRDDVLTAFRHMYPPERDALLSDADYRNKIYGITHFIIADSDYYQKPVDAQTWQWALDTFADNTDAILKRAKEDVYAEVGISFLLAGEGDHPTLKAMQEAIRAAYDPAARMIPGEDGNTNVADGEHRNVLAIMLLDWPEQLHSGPTLFQP